MNIANNWKDYEILDMVDGEKLEIEGPDVVIKMDRDTKLMVPKKNIEKLKLLYKILENYLKFLTYIKPKEIMNGLLMLKIK